MSYILVSENEDDNRMLKLTLQEDGTLLLETLKSKFPKGIGLRYKYYLQENDDNIIIHTAEIYPDDEGKIHLPDQLPLNDSQILKPYYCLKKSKKMVTHLRCVKLASCTTEESLHNAVTDHFGSFANVTSVTIDKENKIGHCTINYEVEKWGEVRKLIDEKCTIDKSQHSLLIKYNKKDEVYRVYKRRLSSFIDGGNYESLVTIVTMFLILHLNRDETVEDFRISCDNAEFGYFNDIVIEVEYLTGSKVIYAIGVTVFYDNVKPSRIETFMHRVVTTVKSIFRQNDFNFENCTRILITNLQLQTSTQHEYDVKFNGEQMKAEIKQKQELSSFENYFKGNIYQFETRDNNASHLFHNFCVCSAKALLDDNITKYMQDIKETFNCDNNVIESFYTFLRNWKQETTRSQFKLDKWGCSTVWENILSVYSKEIQSDTGDWLVPKTIETPVPVPVQGPQIIPVTPNAALEIIRDQHKTVSETFSSLMMEKDRINELTKENVELMCQLEYSHKKLGFLTKAVYPRCVKLYEERLYNNILLQILTNNEKLKELNQQEKGKAEKLKGLNRQEKWKAFFKHGGRDVETFKENIKGQLDEGKVPKIAADTYATLCKIVHSCWNLTYDVLISRNVLINVINDEQILSTFGNTF